MWLHFLQTHKNRHPTYNVAIKVIDKSAGILERGWMAGFHTKWTITFPGVVCGDWSPSRLSTCVVHNKDQYRKNKTTDNRHIPHNVVAVLHPFLDIETDLLCIVAKSMAMAHITLAVRYSTASFARFTTSHNRHESMQRNARYCVLDSQTRVGKHSAVLTWSEHAASWTQSAG